jgi:hypothetical protein
MGTGNRHFQNYTKPRQLSPLCRKTLWFILAFAATAVFLSCTGEPPEIVRVFWQLNIVDDREQDLSYQTLSLFLKPNDPDGFEDIEDVYLINDEQELFWRLDAESWAQSGADQEIWIGSNSLKMPDGASFPAGEYRILLRDIGGDAAEQTIRLELVSLKEARGYLPKVTVRNDEILVSGEDTSYQLWLYDSNRRYVNSFPASSGTVALDTITRSQPPLQSGFSFKVHSFVKDKNLGVTSGPYYVKP